jgi:ring-1,2-phenylacetyl-CoA epoxidase subunit PaaE
MATYIDYKVIKKTFETPITASFVLEPSQKPFQYQPGQFITLLFDHLTNQPVRRSYSISSSPGDPNVRVTVQKIPNGLVSRYLVDKVEVGDKIRGLLPAGRFTLPKSLDASVKKIVLIGGGSGFTPLFSLLQHILKKKCSLQVYLILSNSKPGNILFGNELFQLIARFPDRLRIQFVISHPTKAFSAKCALIDGIELYEGRLSNYLSEKWIRSYLGETESNKALFYVCGPTGLKLKATPVIRMMGFADSRIFEEKFIITEPFRPQAKGFQNAQVEIKYREETFLLDVIAGQTILDAALESGIELPYHCKSGICTTCAGTCVSGKAVMYGQDAVIDTDMSKGDILTCVAYPLTSFLEVEII